VQSQEYWESWLGGALINLGGYLASPSCFCVRAVAEYRMRLNRCLLS
jgi:hypothetical protein